MNVSRLLILAMAVSATASVTAKVDPYGRVYVDINQIAQQSSKGQEIASWSQSKNNELQSLLSTKQAALRDEEQKLMSGQLPEEVAALKAAEFEHNKRQASLDVERRKSQLEAELAGKMRTLESGIKVAIKDLAKEKGWMEVVNAAESKALFFSDKLDVTAEVLAAYNKQEKAEVAKSILRTDTTKAPEILRA